MTVVRAIAPAKLNLGLEVIGRRPDGFHEIATIFQTIDLFDTVTVSHSDELLLDVNDPAIVGESNLALKAAKLLQKRFSISTGAKIQLKKEIPTAAGLGGASSDAAATLRALSLLWELEPTSSEFQEIASSLGSDVPFLLAGGTALGRGRGEIIEPLSRQLSAWVVVAVPKLAIENKTATMFRMLDARDFTPGSTVLAVAKRIEAGETILGLDLPNAFSRHAFRMWPILNELSTHLESAGARGVSLSGAGPSLFTLVSSEDGAADFRDRVRDRDSSNVLVYACKTLSQSPLPLRDNR